MSDVMIGLRELSLSQENGGAPTILGRGTATGESGVAVLNVRFQGGMHLAATLRQHLICFQRTDRRLRFECRMADRTLSHEPPLGSLAICPAGIDCSADTDGSVDAILVAVDPGQFALAAAEDSSLEAQLKERLSGYDRALLEFAGILALETIRDYPNGPLFWNEIASNFIHGLVARHTSASERRTRGTLGKDVLGRLKDYVFANLDGSIEVATLAKLAGRSPFHFSRVFSRSVGMSPHRYVVHLRLQRVVELAREGRSSLAEIAARTGFADQSHLSRWVRRVHGVPLTQLLAQRRLNSTNLQDHSHPLLQSGQRRAEP
jgi:AraC family transcriptional regulator